MGWSLDAIGTENLDNPFYRCVGPTPFSTAYGEGYSAQHIGAHQQRAKQHDLGAAERHLRPTVATLMASTSPRSVDAGAQLACSAALTNPHAAKMAEQSACGDDSQRLVAARVASDSRALLYTLEESGERLPGVVCNTCELFLKRFGPEARDFRTSRAADGFTVSKLIFRVYHQHQRDECPQHHSEQPDTEDRPSSARVLIACRGAISPTIGDRRTMTSLFVEPRILSPAVCPLIPASPFRHIPPCLAWLR